MHGDAERFPAQPENETKESSWLFAQFLGTVKYFYPLLKL